MLLLLILLCYRIYAGYLHYIPQTNHVSIVHHVAALLWLRYIAHVMIFLMFSVLYFYSGEFGSTCAVPNDIMLLRSDISR